MSSNPLYQKCEFCKGTGQAPEVVWRDSPLCPSCSGEKYWPIGLTERQATRAVHEATHFYGADGRAEQIGLEAVKERRIKAAREIEDLRLEVKELEDLRGFVDRVARVCGCNHTGDKDGRGKLETCIEEHIEQAIKEGILRFVATREAP